MVSPALQATFAPAVGARVGALLLDRPPNEVTWSRTVRRIAAESFVRALDLRPVVGVDQEVPYGALVLLTGDGAQVERARAQLEAAAGELVRERLTYDAATDWVGYRSTETIWGAGATAYLVFNNLDPLRRAEFGRWYDRTHIPDAFAHFGFRGAQRLLAPPATGQRFAHLVSFVVPDGTARDCADRRLWIEQQRTAAEKAGRPPLVPLSSAVRHPRFGGFYRVADAWT